MVFLFFFSGYTSDRGRPPLVPSNLVMLEEPELRKKRWKNINILPPISLSLSLTFSYSPRWRRHEHAEGFPGLEFIAEALTFTTHFCPVECRVCDIGVGYEEIKRHLWVGLALASGYRRQGWGSSKRKRNLRYRLYVESFFFLSFFFGPEEHYGYYYYPWVVLYIIGRVCCQFMRREREREGESLVSFFFLICTFIGK